MRSLLLIKKPERIKKTEALIGINPKDTPAIFNPKLLC